MTRVHDLIEAYLGPTMAETDLLEAYTLEHSAFLSRATVTTVEDKILVHGAFYSSTAECAYAGRFERLLYRVGSGLIAHHQVIIVEPQFRRQKIAFCHLTKLIRFYDATNVEYVTLEAVG